MARCECGGPDFVIICPKGCGCICWDDPDWGQECVSYCEGEELPGLGGLVGLSPTLVKSARKDGAPRVEADRHVRVCAHDLPLGILGRAIAEVLGTEVWIPVLTADRRVSSEYEGTMSEVCEQVGLRL